MDDRRTTNWLLAGILLVLSLNLYLQMEHPVQAETFQIDACVTDRIDETPQSYLHVASHPVAE